MATQTQPLTRDQLAALPDSYFKAVDAKDVDAILSHFALRPATANSTVVIVAQRVSTIVDADHVIVLEDGRIVGQGTHEELLDTCTTYQEIVESQRSAEVAA